MNDFMNNGLSSFMNYLFILRRILFIKHSIMSEVAVTEDQFELVSIVEIVQTKLAKNFTLLLKRINNNESLLNQHEQRLAHFQS